MDFATIIGYSCAAAIIMFLITWLALNVHRFGLWVVIVGACITIYTYSRTGGQWFHPYALVMTFIVLLYIAHVITYYFVREDNYPIESADSIG